jgi:hypothetical protein
MVEDIGVKINKTKKVKTPFMKKCWNLFAYYIFSTINSFDYIQ